MDAEYTSRELMVTTAANEIRDDECAFVGMRLPLLAYQVAVSTHAPNALAVFENGTIRDAPSSKLIYTMGDLAHLDRSVSTTGMLDIMGRLQRGDVDVGFIGGAEIDRYGNLNTTQVRAGDRTIRLPGSGGACDISVLSDRTVIIMPHESRRFVESVTYRTSPGHGDGGDWREERGLRGGGPDALITTKGVFCFRDGELTLRSVHPGVTVEEIRDTIPWNLETVGDDGSVETTPEPTATELEYVREFDPDGFWTR
ncbi:CoA-transferase subunit beta [Natrarchaeobius oligotrophus]|uniref:CoA transferase n=1 Tax=Natrarchaeobius chitinivorans TaxID=1679083 RepID=A0A3N6MWJ6_NATCH|nr:CoA-transferase [Natrarchaeobius chitinivorans]RQH02351.1 CoA transferase [Natrarchaeobius chitinivorans]